MSSLLFNGGNSNMANLSPPLQPSPPMADNTLDRSQKGAFDKKSDDGSQKSNDSMAAQQHIENRNTYVPFFLQQLNSEHLDQQTAGMTGHRKTNVLVSELKKHYKLNKLKSFLDHEANTAKGNSSATGTTHQLI